jgi:hypothetical protein
LPGRRSEQFHSFVRRTEKVRVFGRKAANRVSAGWVLTAMASYKVGEQGFIFSGQSVLERTLKGFTIGQIDPKLLTEKNEIASGIPIALRELFD